MPTWEYSIDSKGQGAGGRTKGGRDDRKCREKHSFKVKSQCSRPAASCSSLRNSGQRAEVQCARQLCDQHTKDGNYNNNKGVLASCKGKHRLKGQLNFYPAATEALE